MFVHAVYFWLKDDLAPDRRTGFAEALRGLTSIESVRHGFVGVPAATDRPVIDRSYSYALTVVFDDQAGHDRYQVDPIHERFVEQYKDCWERIVIYDSVEGG